MNIVTGIILPGGWHFRDPSGYRIPAKSELPNPEAVVDAIMQYRLENNIPVGDPEADMEEYVCLNFPSWCRRGTEATPLPAQQETGRRNVDLVSQWANDFYTRLGRLNLVPQNEAEQRASICVNCPQQMHWSGDCPPCVTSAQRLLAILRQGRDTTYGKDGHSLRGCACHKWDNKTAVFIDREHLPEASPESPRNCWVRK